MILRTFWTSLETRDGKTNFKRYLADMSFPAECQVMPKLQQLMSQVELKGPMEVLLCLKIVKQCMRLVVFKKFQIILFQYCLLFVESLYK